MPQFTGGGRIPGKYKLLDFNCKWLLDLVN